MKKTIEASSNHQNFATYKEIGITE